MAAEAWTKERLGSWLLELREKSGISQDRLGERIGRSRQQIIDYEKGRREPYGATLMTMLEKLGVRLEPPPPGYAPADAEAMLRAMEHYLDAAVDAIADRFADAARGREEAPPAIARSDDPLARRTQSDRGESPKARRAKSQKERRAQ